jgi:succinyl-diaminopimelate desuccinylase
MLSRQGLLDRNALGMLLPEPTNGVVWNANRGAISLRVRVYGKPAHVGLQHQGENAFERVHRVVAKLQELKQEVEQRATTVNIGVGQKANSILLIGGQSGGGTNFNVVPAECWFTVDRRINPEENLAAEKSRILEVLDGCRREGIPLGYEMFQEGASASSPESTPLAAALAGAIHAAAGTTPQFEMCPGLLETRFYAAQSIPAYAYGPGLLSVAHGPNEYVDLRKIQETAAIYALTAMRMLNN